MAHADIGTGSAGFGQNDEQRAESIASDYAVGAATVDYRDFDSWQQRLKANTTPQLAAEFDGSAAQLREIIVPLRWVSTASLLAAKVISSSNGVYQVDVFIDSTATTTQSPSPVRTTITYKLTVDRNQGWKISDVSGNQF
ncbi:hypothetical protein H0264_11940 [Nocardia huaxiensis]|uniref:Mce-associated membrane protein n=1 Tax=Nocardia huaxiensis TaxID=2755382 RepID=A0A7D6VE56_9NOCA|nr:hypothetical protein H0264_11940 [Nocardia huaxiensis]